MTALAGLWRLRGRIDTSSACARMLRSQEIYGRHDGSQWSEGHIALGRRLMRVLPEDAFDSQPLIGGEGRYVLVADARLDNRSDLIERLRISPERAKLCSDAAILLGALERWGESCFEHLIGDYAFAFWDNSCQRLLLARDPIGQRPLHYHHAKDFFAFASMPKGLHALPQVPYAPNEERLAELLLLMPDHGSQTFFQGIERVQPGHFVIITPASVRAHRYWRPTERTILLRQPEEYSEALRGLLDEAVRCRLRGATDVGVYLSGGLDSGAVAVTAARLLGATNHRVIAFTGVPRQGYNGAYPRNRIINEWPLAAATASLYPNIEHVLVENEGASPLADLDKSFYLSDTPRHGLCSTGWSHSFTKALSKYQLNVVLGGNLGNLGLSYDGMELLPELLRSGHWIRLWREARGLVSSGRMRWRGAIAQTLGPWCPAPLWIWLNKLVHGHAYEVDNYTAINPQRIADLNLKARAKATDLDLVYRPWKDGRKMRWWALQRIDPGNFRKADLAGWRIDHRDPTADIRLLEFCLSIPTEQFLQAGTPRALVRHALADRMPKMVLEEQRRGLQVADWHEDLTAARDEVVDEISRLEDCASAKTALDLPRLRRLSENWPSGGWERNEVVMPYRYALLRSISVGHFLRRTTGANG